MHRLRDLIRRGLLWRLPVLLGMVMIAGPSIVVYGNALHRLVSGVPVYSDTALRGVQVPAPKPSLSLEDVLSGEFSRSFVAYFGQNFPLLGPAVRAKAQLYWSVLGQSPTWYITIGRDRTLFETQYIEEYCSRDLATFTPAAEDWAAKLVEVQRWYAARGKLFVYLLTPSKAAVEPENLPGGWPCPAAQADRVGLHATYRAILDRAGVNVADAIETTHAAKREYPFPPFPRTGIHFNTVASARAAQAVIDAVNRASTWRRMDDLSFTWHMAPSNEVDTDLLDALNILWSGPPELTPDITVTTPAAPSCHPVLMAQVGGSFAYQVNKAMQRLPCPPKVDLYEYFKNTMAFYPGDTRFPVDPERRSWMLMDAADVVLLEENEQIAARSDHGRAFYDFVRAQMGTQQSGQ